jgi:hypothetical protein
MPFEYEAIKVLFEPEDGTCPEVCLVGIGGPQVIRGFALILESARFLVGAPYFFSTLEKTDKLVKSVPNAAELVVKGEAEPFHFLCRFVATSHAPLPEIGVFVFENGFAIDFEKGLGWGAGAAEGLLELLANMAEGAETPHLVLEEAQPESLKEAMQREFLVKFLEQSSGRG